ncbi:MAG TPA: nuclear transport factor 2 family protein [bacterium]|nr:nuclear transport factor 2 family protein [bacterium]
MKSTATATVIAFIDAINRGDVTRLSNLMTEDHIFVDSGGSRSPNSADLIRGWSEYFRMFPDYRIEIENIIQEENLVAVFGTATGTYDGNRGLVPENQIKMPAAWRAVVENGRVKLWQVYADWTEGWKIIEADRKQG